MKYRKFIIRGYRGISDETEINLTKESIIPIIGKNESGKTTCLEAINTFDYSNDQKNEGSQLKNVENLYSTLDTPVIVAAEIQVDRNFKFDELFKEYFDTTEKEFNTLNPGKEFNVLTIDTEGASYSNLDFIKAYQILFNEISNSKPLVIERDLKEMKYSFTSLSGLLPSDFESSLAERFVLALPYILYFDDFRDRMPEKVHVIEDSTSSLYNSWITFIDQLFKDTHSEYSVFSLTSKQDSQRRSIVTEVQEHLNEVLAKEWSKYQFENSESISVRIECLEDDGGLYLKFKIVEHIVVDGKSKERYFDLADRSKGFYWYFNFMFKLHFNPSKRDVNDIDTIYLLDEPGSYLHTYALNKLAEQLKRLSESNKVIYCTHFHNLLNPEFIPINSIRVSEKINQGKISLKRLDEMALIRGVKNSAYQPVLDALEVKPPLVEYDFDNIVLVEGIYDFYSFKMFTSNTINYFPCVSASSIINQIPYMIFLGKKYLALWDDDSEGRDRFGRAEKLFGEVEAEKFLLLEGLLDKKNTILQDLFDTNELKVFNANILKQDNISFTKSILSLFYKPDRENLIVKYFPNTKLMFSKVEAILQSKLKAQKISAN